MRLVIAVIYLGVGGGGKGAVIVDSLKVLMRVLCLWKCICEEGLVVRNA